MPSPAAIGSTSAASAGEDCIPTAARGADKILTFQKLTCIAHNYPKRGTRRFRLGRLRRCSRRCIPQAIENAQNGNGRVLLRVGAGLGLAPLPLGVGAMTARPRRTLLADSSKKQLALGSRARESDSLHSASGCLSGTACAKAGISR